MLAVAVAAVALVHAAAVVVLVVGPLVALRHPKVLWLHLPVAVVIGGVYLAGADCPLTTLELALRERAGLPGYEDGFLGHYLLAPLGLDRADAGTQAGLLLAALLPHVVAVVAALARRRSRVTSAR